MDTHAGRTKGQLNIIHRIGLMCCQIPLLMFSVLSHTVCKDDLVWQVFVVFSVRLYIYLCRGSFPSPNVQKPMIVRWTCGLSKKGKLATPQKLLLLNLSSFVGSLYV